MIETLVAISLVAMVVGACLPGLPREILASAAWTMMFANWFWSKTKIKPK